MDNWYVPITIVPAIGLLILSTSHLLVGLSAEIKTLLDENRATTLLKTRKLQQLKLLNTALVFLYISVAFLVVSGLISGLYQTEGSSFGASLYFTITGIGSFLCGLVGLIVYSVKAVKLRQDQFNNKC